MSFFLAKELQKIIFYPIREAIVMAKSAVNKGKNLHRVENAQDELEELQYLLEEILLQKFDALEQHDELYAVMKGLTEMLIVVSNDGMITMLNPTCEKILEYSPGELEGQSIEVLFGKKKEMDRTSRL